MTMMKNELLFGNVHMIVRVVLITADDDDEE